MTKEEVRQLLDNSKIWERDSNTVVYFAYIEGIYCEINLNEDNLSYAIHPDEDTWEHIAHIPYKNIRKIGLEYLRSVGIPGIGVLIKV